MNDFKGTDNILPSDNTLVDREKKWQALFTKYENANDEFMEDYNEDEIDEVHKYIWENGETVEDDVDDDDSSDTDDNFVDDSEEDETDMQELAEKSLVAARNRISNWRKNGIRLKFKSYLHNISFTHWLETLNNNKIPICMRQSNAGVFRTMTISEYSYGNSIDAAVLPVLQTPTNFPNYAATLGQYTNERPLALTYHDTDDCMSLPNSNYYWYNQTPSLKQPYQLSSKKPLQSNYRKPVESSALNKKTVRNFSKKFRKLKTTSAKNLKHHETVYFGDNSSDDDSFDKRQAVKPILPSHCLRTNNQDCNVANDESVGKNKALKKKQVNNENVENPINVTYVIQTHQSKQPSTLASIDDAIFKKPTNIPVRQKKPKTKLNTAILKPSNKIQIKQANKISNQSNTVTNEIKSIENGLLTEVSHKTLDDKVAIMSKTVPNSANCKIIIYSPSKRKYYGECRQTDNTISISVAQILEAVGTENLNYLFPNGVYRRLRCNPAKRLIFERIIENNSVVGYLKME